MKVLILGANSETARELASLLEARGIPYSHRSVEELPARPDTLQHALVTEGIEEVVHLPDCGDFVTVEQDHEAAARCETLNTDWMVTLAAACAALDLPLLHLSTSMVFDGTRKAPYTEEDPCNPLGRYGALMSAGEHILREAHPRHVILRTDSLFCAADVEWIRAKLDDCRRGAGKLALLDRRFSPTPAADVARVLMAILLQVDCHAQVWGTYHYCALQPLTEAQFVEGLLREAARHEPALARHCEALEIELTPAFPPWIANSALNCQKIMETFGIKQRSRAPAVTWLIEELFGLPHAGAAQVPPAPPPAPEQPAPRERKRKKAPRKGGARKRGPEEGGVLPTEAPAREAAAKKP